MGRSILHWVLASWIRKDACAQIQRLAQTDMSYSLNSFKGVNVGDYIGDYYSGY